MPLEFFNNPNVQKNIALSLGGAKDTFFAPHSQKVIDNLQGESLFGTSEDEGYNNHTLQELSDQTYKENALGENQEWTAIPNAGLNLAKSFYNGMLSVGGAVATLGVNMFTPREDSEDVEMFSMYNQDIADEHKLHLTDNISKATDYAEAGLDNNIYYSPKDDFLGKNYSEWTAALGNQIANSLPAAYVGGGIGGAVTKGIARLATPLAKGLGASRVLGVAANNNLGFLAKVGSGLTNPKVIESFGKIVGGHVQSRIIGEQNAFDTYKDTYNESFKRELIDYKKSIKDNLSLTNPNVKDVDIENAMDESYVASLEKKSRFIADQAAETVRGLSWLTGILNVSSSAKFLGGSLIGKAGTSISGAARSKPFTNGYWKNYWKEAGLEVAQEIPEELYEGITQNYAKDKALYGNKANSFLKTAYNTIASPEGAETIFMAGMSAFAMSSGHTMKDVSKGGKKKYDNDRNAWLQNSKVLESYKNQIDALDKAKTPYERETILKNLKQSSFLSNLTSDSLKSSLFTKMSEFANDNNQQDVADLFSKTSFATQLHNTFVLGYGDTLQHTLDSLGNKENTDFLKSIVGVDATDSDIADVKKRISELKSISKVAEKIYNSTMFKFGDNPIHAKKLFDKKITAEILKDEILKNQVITQEKLQNAMATVSSTDLLTDPNIAEKHREITNNDGMGKALEFLQEESLQKANNQDAIEYQNQKQKQNILDETFSNLLQDIKILENVKPTKDSKGTLHSTPEEAIKENKKIEKSEIDTKKKSVDIVNTVSSELEKERSALSLNNEELTDELENTTDPVRQQEIGDEILKNEGIISAIENEIKNRSVKQEPPTKTLGNSIDELDSIIEEQKGIILENEEMLKESPGMEEFFQSAINEANEVIAKAEAEKASVVTSGTVVENSTITKSDAEAKAREDLLNMVNGTFNISEIEINCK